METNTKKELLRFLGFHVRSSNLLINCVNSIVSSSNVLPQIVEVLTLLQKDFSILFYSGKGTDTKRFLEKLAEDLSHEKTVLIVADTLSLDPVIYDQLIQFRENNKFTIDLKKEIKNFPTNSKLFLFFSSLVDKEKEKIYEISDHVLNV